MQKNTKIVVFLFCIFLAAFLLGGYMLSSSTPTVHFPQGKLAVGNSFPFLIGYCWQMPDGRTSQTHPENKEVGVVISDISGQQKIVIRDEYNLPPSHFSDFYIYKTGCIEDGDKIRYVANAISVSPQKQIISLTSGSDVNITDLAFFQVDLKNSTYAKVPTLIPENRGGYFLEPKRIFWAPDESKYATLGMDVSLISTGDNIWVYDLKKKSFQKATTFNRIGEWVVNAAWSADGKKLAVGMGDKISGVQIIDCSISGVTCSAYKLEMSHTTSPAIGEWPYIYKNLLQLFLENEKIRFTRYVYAASIPIWLPDNRVVFTAANQDGFASLYIMDETGKNLTRLAEDLSGNLFMPTLSPDGRTLAFVRYFDWMKKDKVEIRLLDLRTMKTDSLLIVESSPEVKTSLFISGMMWSPDGQYLAFSSNHDGESDIYIVGADGKSWLNVTKDAAGNATSPFWFRK
jgi:TolB protein